MRNRIGIWAVVLLIVFLIGFVPPYMKSNRLQGELETANQNLTLAKTRALLGVSYMEATRKNYGIAGEYASQFFNQVRELSGRADPDLRKKLEDLFGHHDQVTAGLAKGDPGVLGPMQQLYEKTETDLRR